MSLWIIHKGRTMKTYEEVERFAEKYYGTKLLPFQKLLLKTIFTIQGVLKK